jgi:hypothetical protein
VPFVRPYGFKVIYTGIPAIEEDKTGLKTPFLCFAEHILKMIIFRLVVYHYVVDSAISGNRIVSICPEQRADIDSIHYPMLLPAPLMIDQIHLFGVRLIQERIVDNQDAILKLNDAIYLIPQRIRVWRLTL